MMVGAPAGTYEMVVVHVYPAMAGFAGTGRAGSRAVARAVYNWFQASVAPASAA
jgi:hypothetical protein